MPEPTLEAFATAEQMAARTDGAIPATRPHLNDALLAVTRRIQRHCRWHIAPQREQTLTLPARRGSTLWLPTAHLVDVVELSTGGHPIDVSQLDWSEDGELGYTGWVTGRRSVTVKIVHGYATVPEDLTELCLQVAARALGSPLGILREQAGAVAVTYSASGTVLLPAELAQLVDYRLGRLP